MIFKRMNEAEDDIQRLWDYIADLNQELRETRVRVTHLEKPAKRKYTKKVVAKRNGRTWTDEQRAVHSKKLQAVWAARKEVK